MLNTLTKLAMVISFAVFTGFVLHDWGGQVLGWHDEIHYVLDLPDDIGAIPIGLALLGGAVAILGIVGVALSFTAISRILSAGPSQDFRRLAQNLERMAYGLILFWLCNYAMHSGVRTLILLDAQMLDEGGIMWDPFGPDMIFAIIAVALLAIAKMMDRAWQAEEETKHFL